MGDRGHNRNGPKKGGLLGTCLTHCGLGQGLLPYQVASLYIQLFDTDINRTLGGAVPLLGGGSRDPI